MLSSSDKLSIIETHKQSAQDTGSPEVQVSLLTADISSLTEHMKRNKKDLHSRRGLTQKVSRRRKLLDYLKSVSQDRYQKLIEVLGLRR